MFRGIDKAYGDIYIYIYSLNGVINKALCRVIILSPYSPGVPPLMSATETKAEGSGQPRTTLPMAVEGNADTNGQQPTYGKHKNTNNNKKSVKSLFLTNLVFLLFIRFL